MNDREAIEFGRRLFGAPREEAHQEASEHAADTSSAKEARAADRQRKAEHPSNIHRPDEPEGSDGEPAVDPFVAHLRSQTARRNALTAHLLGQRDRPEPTGPNAATYAEAKRESQRNLIEALHGGAEQTAPGLPPIVPSTGPDHTEPPPASDEGRPTEFEPPFPGPDRLRGAPDSRSPAASSPRERAAGASLTI